MGLGRRWPGGPGARSIGSQHPPPRPGSSHSRLLIMGLDRLLRICPRPSSFISIMMPAVKPEGFVFYLEVFSKFVRGPDDGCSDSRAGRVQLGHGDLPALSAPLPRRVILRWHRLRDSRQTKTHASSAAASVGFNCDCVSDSRSWALRYVLDLFLFLGTHIYRSSDP